MRDYIFGNEAEPLEGTGAEDFFLNRGNADNNGDEGNPYSKDGYLNNPLYRLTTKEKGRITSIPSPYARMHLTDIAFEEANCGIGKLSTNERDRLEIAPDYLKAMSHCLDMFELMFHADEFNLSQMGITLEKLKLISTDTIDDHERKILFDDHGRLTELGRYIETLDLYRDSYMRTIARRRTNVNTSYHFDFRSLYVFKYRGKVFAATSPFTGFFTKADCDLAEANIIINGHKLFSSDSSTWLRCQDRDRRFIEFLYLLLKEYGLDKIFCNLFTSLKDVIDRDSAWMTRVNNTRFEANEDYKKFNMSGAGLQQIPGHPDVFIRPNGLDCSYLKFLLYLQNPVDLSISNEEYSKPLDQRKFDSQFLRWIGVNDILSDALFVLPYDVNENYTVIPYIDATRANTEFRRCLVPIKSEVLAYFSLDELVKNITIIRNSQEFFTVELKVQLEGGNTTVLRREYHKNPAMAGFPNGKLFQGDMMKKFAFGAYPFVKSESELNIYKILFYNVFDGEYRLDFYRKNAAGNMVKLLDAEHLVNKTNDISDEAVPYNHEYHHVQHTDGFEYAELVVNNQYSSLIIPRLRKIQIQPNTVNVAIDLGTSNTYIAYSVVNPYNAATVDIREINTHHVTAAGVEWNELTFMNMQCEAKHRPEGVNVCNSDDLVVRENDDPAQKANSDMLDHQLCEFIPSRISDNGSNYRFPIPSVLNFLRVDTKRLSFQSLPVSNPLINTAIPFAYYERGMRQRVGKTNYYYDIISKGNVFKWYLTRNAQGGILRDNGGEAAFKAFIRELLFIVRCHILSEGFELKNVNVYWSYPLSFELALLAEYEREWDAAFADIIDSNIIDANGNKRIHYTCESRSPIYHCINPVSVRQMTLLVDIGGGSTDVIGYREFRPLFVSSTKFAGNTLYLCGDLNNRMFSTGNDCQSTLMYKYVKAIKKLSGGGNETLSGGGNNNDGSVVTQTIGLNEDLATIMNYGFAKYPNEFRQIFLNNPAEFMLRLHNSALLYHIAQLCHTKSPEEAPRDIYLTGNGSKQLVMNPDYVKMVRSIFSYVYKAQCDEITITFPDEPKAATAKGTLQGITNNHGKIALDKASQGDSYIAFGDGGNILLQDTQYGARVTPECSIDNVIKNAHDFVNMFYNVIYPTPMPTVTREKLQKTIDDCRGSLMINNNLVDDSLFLRLIAETMERLSVRLAQEINI